MNMTDKKLFQNDKKKTKILKKQAEDSNKQYTEAEKASNMENNNRYKSTQWGNLVKFSEDRLIYQEWLSTVCRSGERPVPSDCQCSVHIYANVTWWGVNQGASIKA